MPMSWCELEDAMRARRYEWDGHRPWDDGGRFVPLDPGPIALPIESAIRLLGPWTPPQDEPRGDGPGPGRVAGPATPKWEYSFVRPLSGGAMTTQAIPSQAQLEAILAALREVPYQTAETALTTQLKAIDDWERQVQDQPALAAMAGVLRAQVQAAQRMLDVTRRESQQVAEAMGRAAKAFGVPRGS
jgi:hypothetical protein